MKASLVLLLLLLVALVSGTPWSWTGNTTGSATYLQPDFTPSPFSCALDTDAIVTPYVVFNATIPTYGVYEIIVLSEEYFDDIVVYIYSGGFNASNPCANIFDQLDVSDDEDDGFFDQGIVDYWNYFAPGTYHFVVTGDDDGDQISGLWALSINPSTNSSVLTVSNPEWTPAYIDEFGDCYLDDSTTPYSYFSWTQSTTGHFDVLVLFVNSTAYDWETYAVIYQGNINNWTALAVNPCNATAFGTQVVQYGDYDGYGVTIYYVSLTAGVNYTVVFSGTGDYENTDIGHYAVQVIPTRFVLLTNYPGFTQPDYDDYPPPQCNVGDNTNSSAWGVSTFAASETGFYLFYVAYPDANNNEYFADDYVSAFLYQGNNTASPPSACGYPLLAETETEESTYLYISSPQNLSIVGSDYDEESVDGSNYGYVVFGFTGTYVAIIPPTTVTVATLSSTTATTATTATTTTKATTTATTATTATTSTSTSTTTSSSSSTKPTTTTTMTTSTTKAPTSTTSSNTTSTTTSKPTSSSSSSTGAPVSTTTAGASALCASVLLTLSALLVAIL